MSNHTIILPEETYKALLEVARKQGLTPENWIAAQLSMEALYKSLGVAGALRFLSLLHREQTDYVDVSKRVYREQTIDEIFARAGQNWQG
ncbi:MAG: hypothetical protein F6K24_49550 [Okeania sp. SIO2D1]|nr:hypothetical protein [Okeania sp. SIO2D1]